MSVTSNTALDALVYRWKNVSGREKPGSPAIRVQHLLRLVLLLVVAGEHRRPPQAHLWVCMGLLVRRAWCRTTFGHSLSARAFPWSRSLEGPAAEVAAAALGSLNTGPQAEQGEAAVGHSSVNRSYPQAVKPLNNTINEQILFTSPRGGLAVAS